MKIITVILIVKDKPGHAGASFPGTCSLSFDSQKKKRRFVGWPVRYIKSIFFSERPKNSRDGRLTYRSARGRW